MPEDVLLMDTKIAVVGSASLGCDETLQGLFEGQRLFLTENQLLVRFCPYLRGNPFGDLPIHGSCGPNNGDVIDLELDIPELGI